MAKLGLRGALRRDDRGAALVEFALAMVFLPLLAFGVVDFARAYQLQTKLRNAAREGAFFGQYYPANIGPTTSCTSSGSSQTIVARATGADSSYSITSASVTVYKNGSPLTPNTCNTAFATGDRLTVTVTGTFKVLTPLVAVATGRTTYLLTASHTVVIQR